MTRVPGFHHKIFFPLFFLLAAASAVSAAAATAVFTSRISAVLMTVVALLTSLAVCALASDVVARSITQASRQLAGAIENPPGPEGARVDKSLVYAEIQAAWDKAELRLERSLNHEQAKAMCSKTEMNELLCNIAKALEERSTFLRGHSERVAEYAVGVAEDMCLDQETISRLRLASMVHDLGLIGMSEPVLQKSRALAMKEFEILRAHPARGAAILRSIDSLSDLIPAVEFHHEALDGSGYPYGLSGDEIPLLARILTVADTFDALTCADPYQPAMGQAQAMDVLNQMVGTRLDSSVVAALTRFLAMETEAVDPEIPTTETLHLPGTDHVVSEISAPSI